MEAYLGLWLGFISVMGGFAIAFYAVWLKSKSREMRHREHMAMIEKGLVPPATGDVYPLTGGDYQPARHRRNSAILITCTGIGLMMLFGLGSGNWRTIWIGGFVTMIGVAFLLIALLDLRDQRTTPRAGDAGSSADRQITS